MAIQESGSVEPAGSVLGVQSERGRVLEPGLFILAFALLLFTFRDGLINMLGWWESPEYSHGYLIPLISLYLLSVRLITLEQANPAPSWVGVGVVVAGLAGFLLGELSALFIIVQYSFVLVLWGIVLTQVGWRGIKVLWPVLVFLLFMVPLPAFIQFNLSSTLQLISSDLGTAILRLMGLSVYLEGNVIDLGVYKLQVVDACAGLRYLFPLMSFGMLCAVVLKGPAWQRILLFASSAPIAIVMNSFRIAVTGVLVNRFGTEAAEGFLHYFEGWVVFTICLVLMFLLMTALAKLSGQKLDDVLDFELPTRASLQGLGALLRPNRPLTGVVLLLALAGAASFFIANREEIIPARTTLTSFPLTLGEWRGREGEIAREQLDELKLTDYVIATYNRPGAAAPVELYVAYYDSQRKGASIHSPRACLPGGGWAIEEFSQVPVPGAGPEVMGGDALTVNRSLISLGDQRMLVYYWFQGRGRIITNEYLAKWYIFWDSLTRNRTDGALVRVITIVPDVSQIAAADERLREFIVLAAPRLSYHIPGEFPIAP
ncbi:MAG: VPLPA-CTERM-specific exosortase XrtD [Chromatiales bacterium]|nr:VPLPA-CTERM-specific exosortase XrtD [Chromatiales bacterium]